MSSTGFDYTPSVMAKMAVGYVGTIPVPPPDLGIQIFYLF